MGERIGGRLGCHPAVQKTALSASDFAVITSGTATLQASLLGIPMVVIYKVSPFSYLIGKFLIKVKHISLVNIILNRDVVKELIQRDATPLNIFNEFEGIYTNKKIKNDMVESLQKIRSYFDNKHPTKRVAEIVEEMIEQE